MQETEVIRRVETRFAFLVNKYKYHAIACSLFANFDNWIVVLESVQGGRMLVMQDRGEIIVALGPHGPSSSATAVPWFDLGVVLEYLSHGKLMLGEIPGDPDQQMSWLAVEIHPYMDQICDLFGSANAFAEARADLDRIGARREASV